MNSKEIIGELKKNASLENKEAMTKFGINSKYALGVNIPVLRKLARKIGVNHELAIELWATTIHEARILASMIEDPYNIPEKQIDSWIKDFNSWDLCDQCCMNLFYKTRFAFQKAVKLIENDREFTRRTGFVMIACLAWHRKADDSEFIKLLPLIKQYSIDDRNFVKKAVNWALRQIGKRNRILNKHAIELAKEIQTIDSKSAKWISSNALRELGSKEVQLRLD
ncbi:MAG: DNA alkylation repair protein [Candidatus Aenigmatarchaeota archaeon]